MHFIYIFFTILITLFISHTQFAVSEGSRAFHEFVFSGSQVKINLSENDLQPLRDVQRVIGVTADKKASHLLRDVRRSLLADITNQRNRDLCENPIAQR